jgi:NAD(P)H-hydrate epimerase
LARHFLVAGISPTVILSRKIPETSKELHRFLDVLQRLGCKVEESTLLNDEQLARLFSQSGGIVDALLGTGSRGPARGECARLLSLIPEEGPVKVALDIPSGVDPSTGEIASVAFRADLTLTFLGAKIGLRVMPGAALAGEIETLPIGVPSKDILPAATITGYTLEDAAADWPRPVFSDHKGKKGTVLVLGGSRNYRGAPLLTARAALRAGSGLVVLIVPECIARTASSFLPEAIVISASTVDDQEIDPVLAIDSISNWKPKAGVLVLGPGLGRLDSTACLVDFFSSSWEKPILFDADALHFIKGLPYSGSSLITPHEGEADNMLRVEPGTAAGHRLKSTKELSARFGTALLKGPYSLCCDRGVTGIVLETSPALAIPGSGDVLSGIAGSLLARGLSPLKSALAAAVVHASTGKELARRFQSETGLLSSEIADALPYTIARLFPGPYRLPSQ